MTVDSKWEKVFDYEYVSFDIFNTVLMRSVSEPNDIFKHLGKRLLEEKLLPEEYSVSDFVRLREEAERNVQSKNYKLGKAEYFLRDIYNEFPEFISDNYMLYVEYEVEMEKKHSFINPFVYQLIKELHKEKKKIILISDMYLNEYEIRDLLNNAGFDLSLIDELFVSSECGVNKRDGKLFEYVIKKIKIEKDKMIHIGDNFLADVYGANLASVQSLMYGVFENEPLEMIVEKELFGENHRLNSKRLIINDWIKKTENDNFWFLQGALIWGPVLYSYAEWMIQIVKREKIKNIYPLMREAILIEKVLAKQLEKHSMSKDINVKRMYVSRDTTFLTAFECFGEDVYEYFFTQRSMTVHSMFIMLGIEEFWNEIPEKFDTSMTDIRKNSLHKELYDFLSRNYIVEKINTTISDKKEALYSYLKNQFNLSESFITADLGFTGTITNSIHSLLKEKGHTIDVSCGLILRNEYAISRILSGTKIYGFIAENNNYNSGISRYYKFMEGLFMDETGSTKGYLETNESVEPILRENIVPTQQLSDQQQFQKGVLYFQDYMNENYDSSYGKNHSTECKDILTRLFECPTTEEAKYYLKNSYEQNVGNNVIEEIPYEKELAILREEGAEYFLEKQSANDVYWPQGIVALEQMDYNYKKMRYKYNKTNIHLDLMMNICKTILDENIKEVIVYGAGDVGKAMAKAVRFYGIDIVCFVDRNDKLWGQELTQGKVVCSIEEANKYDCENIVIASLAWVDDIRSTIKEKMKVKKIYSV